MYRCRKCPAEVPVSQKACQVCGTDAGFPNVRSAELPSEREALDARYDAAVDLARDRGSLTALDAFEMAVGSSNAIMNRWLGTLSSWINGEDPLFHTFHFQVKYLGRKPQNNEWDQQRGAAESAVNPHIFEDLHYAALSLDGLGTTYYGPYSVILKTLTIEDRASVFEQNPFVFLDLHHVVVGQMPPLGFRAPWQERGRLAVAKLGDAIRADTKPEAFSKILMEDRRSEADCDFIEVHIYGPINRAGIDKIVGPMPVRKADRLVWSQTKRKALSLGIAVEVIT